MIRNAGAGDARQRDEFVRRYVPAIKAYFRARWPEAKHAHEVDDAAQEVFVDCFREDGTLARADEKRPGGFRVFLQGVARVVAQRAERKRGRAREQPDDDLDRIERDEPTLSRAFDRAWALQLAREAVRRNHARARSGGSEVQQRLEILRLRFTEGLPIREIAPRLEMEVLRCHREYAKARAEFHKVLLEVVAERSGSQPEDVEQECVELMALLD